MAFYVKPQKEFLVRPALAGGPLPHVRVGIQPALELGSQLARAVSAPGSGAVEGLRKQSGPDAGTCSAGNAGTRRQRSAISALYRRACERYDSYMQPAGDAGRRQTDRVFLDGVRPHRVPADLLRRSGTAQRRSSESSSDADYPLIAVGLLYQKGYHQQWLNPDGWQQERYPINDFYTLPVEAGSTMQTATRCHGRREAADRQSCTSRSGIIDVGRVKLYLLDTNIPENPSDEHRDITDSLYGGDIHTRMRQEIVLGIGGLRRSEGSEARADRVPHE